MIRMNSVYLRRIVSIFSVCLVGFSTLHYMRFNKEAALRWDGKFPYVAYVVNAAMPVIGADPNAVIAAVRTGAERWFVDGSASFSYGYEGLSPVSFSASPSAFSCDGAIKTEFLLKKANVYASTTDDPDCTGNACSLIWSCGNEIVHFDTQINAFDFAWTADANSGNAQNLSEAISHEFGHGLGLGHCESGDSASYCATPGAGLANPPANNLMHAFPAKPGVPVVLGADDSAGIQAIYGNFQSPFPKTGPLALSPGEIRTIGSEMQWQEDSGSNRVIARKDQARMLKEMFDFVDSGAVANTLDVSPIPGYVKGETARQYFDKSIATMTASLPQVPTNQLAAMRGTLAAGVVIMEDLLAKGGSELPDTAFLNHIQEQNLALRAAIIAELGRRP